MGISIVNTTKLSFGDMQVSNYDRYNFVKNVNKSDKIIAHNYHQNRLVAKSALEQTHYTTKSIPAINQCFY